MSLQPLMTHEEFDALVALIDSRVQLAVQIAAHPNDRPRTERLRADAQHELITARVALTQKQE